MRFVSINNDGKEQAAVLDKEWRSMTLPSINEHFNKSWPSDLFELIQPGIFSAFQRWWGEQPTEETDQVERIEYPEYRPLYRHPRKIWGIGLNYVDHASDLDEQAPQGEPASFMKPDTTIIGYGDRICLPHQSERTTGEAELGIIIGKECKDVSVEEAEQVIAGYTTVIDMTAEDILKRNPRYLTRSKSFDTFFSFGPQLVTPNEIGDVGKLEVSTVLNGDVHRSNKVENMTFPPYYLVSFHSQVMTLKPGDIISTGTPGAIVLRDGDIIECQIDGFPSLRNPVTDLKKQGKGGALYGSTAKR
ncbi:2-keto-4-pentenoate hydratase/2-oxohepta-3-ene-1,7-dioic acid hydratase (catechol pathway) [Halobacillus dabanensis]|uniref:2-keto-4-pentenoate hydratase/2-oxohepta-3-ene-1,7-dioic acid hydratase (Catechol pathway) n=1 Tax=Halobacillus dabanensis TaxID=240302 RepID=A0A1I3RTT5_HALDA|nr:fumarylacetoacetate hydrolase family protein [Halobacillus dabanensis]SFJ48606.1 2-keto-4-pentenoate hydratase/2-oxohepta-3-ene-1,7-dioic acid hydratase (catechol pathway) [Halobacillus dabanensis]